MLRIALAVVFTSAPVAVAGDLIDDARPHRFDPTEIRLKDVPRLRANMIPISAGGCPVITTGHTNADFSGGSFMVQAGFAEQEIAAASYTLSPDAFPIQLDLAEMIFATSNASVQTTTHWTFLVWEGTPQGGTLVASYSSDDVILPHLVMQPGTNGTNIQVSVDPGDPDQIVITDNGSHTFSIGYRIDQHNNQADNPCLIPPPSSANAFPTTDVGGLASATGNWLLGVNCGLFGCPPGGGWANFQQLATFCTPSGDWVMRASWHSLGCAGDLGACCLPDGSCLDDSTANCSNAGGNFIGVGLFCSTVECPTGLGACCIEADCADLVAQSDCTKAGGVWLAETDCDGGACPTTGACCIPASGGCIDLTEADCTVASGIYQGLGSDCTGLVCFPSGACCLFDGSCTADTSPEACGDLGGTFQGHESTCAAVECPLPMGACCLPAGCLDLSENDCAIVAGTWSGISTSCDDDDGSGEADACEASCPADLDGDQLVGFIDLLEILSTWGPCGDPCPQDLDASGDVAFPDLLAVLSAWGDCP